MTRPKPLRILWVGLGAITRQMLPAMTAKPWYIHAGALEPNPHVDLTGIPPGPVWSMLDEALRQVTADAVVINTPSHLHHTLGLATLDAGLHTLIAKPITQRYDEAVELVDRAASRGVTLSVAQQLRYNRHYSLLSRFLAEGKLGHVEAVWLMNSKPRPQVGNLGTMPQPSLFENSCHHFDCLLAMFPDRIPKRLVCDGFIPSWSAYHGPCMVNALIEFSSGLHVSYHGGFSSRAAMYELRIEGESGSLRCRGLHMSHDAMSYEFAPALGSFTPLPLETNTPAVNPWDPFMDRWYDYVCGGDEPPISGRNNLRVMAMIDAANRSMASGKWEEVIA